MHDIPAMKTVAKGGQKKKDSDNILVKKSYFSSSISYITISMILAD